MAEVKYEDILAIVENANTVEIDRLMQALDTLEKNAESPKAFWLRKRKQQANWKQRRRIGVAGRKYKVGRPNRETGRKRLYREGLRIIKRLEKKMSKGHKTKVEEKAIAEHLVGKRLGTVMQGWTLVPEAKAKGASGVLDFVTDTTVERVTKGVTEKFRLVKEKTEGDELNQVAAEALSKEDEKTAKEVDKIASSVVTSKEIAARK